MAAIVLVPLLVAGMLGGVRVVSHAHDDHGTHWHLESVGDQAAPGAAAHAAHHADELEASPGHDGTHAHDEEKPHGRTPGETLFSWPELHPAPPRGLGLAKSCSLTTPSAAIELSPLFWARLDGPMGASGAPPPIDPRDRCGIGATERLVRTSCALLI